MLRTPRIVEAFEAIDRKRFVPETLLPFCYEDAPLPIGEGQTISQPTTVAFMLELLQVRPGEHVLDIGSGSGWTAALLGHLVGPSGSVLGLERVAELVRWGAQNLAPFGFGNVRIEQAAEQLGVPGERFDAILVSASAETVPTELLEQLEEGGRLVIPVRNSLFRFYKRPSGEIEQEEYPGFVFVPLIYGRSR